MADAEIPPRLTVVVARLLLPRMVVVARVRLPTAAASASAGARTGQDPVNSILLGLDCQIQAERGDLTIPFN